MIEVLQGFRDQVAAYACSGHLTKADYKKILADVEDRYTRHKKLRCYTEVASDFNGLDPGAPGAAGDEPCPRPSPSRSRPG